MYETQGCKVIVISTALLISTQKPEDLQNYRKILKKALEDDTRPQDSHEPNA
jgi:hypothetical protein